MNPSLCIGEQPLVFLPPRSDGKFHGRYSHPTGVSMQSHSQRKFPSLLKAVASSKSKRSVFACNAALNAKCSQGQTQTVTRESPTITQAPTHGNKFFGSFISLFILTILMLRVE
ncbi:Uncharacterized protein HA466_0252620 [Hirschfeldia incana]|nr:Uncharacterized protein HA466_0252620 [Hirschfeldia incana]